MRVIYRLVGYNKQTEFLETSFDIPSSEVTRAKHIAGITTDGDTQIGDWELSERQARDIAQAIGRSAMPDHYDYFLEPYVFQDDVSGDPVVHTP